METLWQDLRYGVRAQYTGPGFVLVGVQGALAWAGLMSTLLFNVECDRSGDVRDNLLRWCRWWRCWFATCQR